MPGEFFQLRALGEELGQLLVAGTGKFALNPGDAALDELVAKPQHDVLQLLGGIGDGPAVGHGLGGEPFECVGRQNAEQFRHAGVGIPGVQREMLLQNLAHGGVRHPVEVEMRLKPLGGVAVDESQLQQPQLDRPRLGHRLFSLPGQRLVVLRFRLPEGALLFLELGAHGVGIDTEPVADLLRVGVD